MPRDEFDTLSNPTSADEYTAAMGRLCRAEGAEHFIAVRLFGARLGNVVQVLHNAPAPELVQGMQHWSLVRLLDHARATPVPWLFGTGAAPGPEVPGFASGVVAMAREPRGATVIVLGTSAPTVAGLELQLVQAALLAAHHSVEGLQKLHSEACPLSERELQCLQMAFTGEYSSREIGKALEISARTVEHYLEQARAKCGKDATIAAAVYAVNQGWMDLPKSGSIKITS